MRWGIRTAMSCCSTPLVNAVIAHCTALATMSWTCSALYCCGTGGGSGGGSSILSTVGISSEDLEEGVKGVKMMCALPK